MELETQERLQGLLNQVVDVLCLVSGTQSYEGAIAALRTQFRDKKTSPAAWIHKIARETYLTNESDSVNPEYFYEILGMIDTREKSDAVLASLPEEAAPEIEKVLKFVMKELFPSQRLKAEQLAKRLPHRRGGGPKPKMPSQDECRQICDRISKLHAKGVPLGEAQRQAAERWNKSVRMIQRVWARRDVNS